MEYPRVLSCYLFMCYRHTLREHCMVISSSESLLILNVMFCWIACKELKFCREKKLLDRLVCSLFPLLVWSKTFTEFFS